MKSLIICSALSLTMAVNASYGGEITEAASFMPTPYFQQPYWVLNNSVNITSPSGFIYSTD